MMRKSIAILLGGMVLAGCGAGAGSSGLDAPTPSTRGSGSSTAPESPPLTGAPTERMPWADRTAILEGLTENALAGGFAPETALPLRGRWEGKARIESEVAIGIGVLEQLVGDMSLEADFTTGNVSGRIERMSDFFGEAVDGTLDIQARKDTHPIFAGSLTGEACFSRGFCLDFDSRLDAAFTGRDADHVLGEISGGATGSNGAAHVVSGVLAGARAPN